MKERCNQGLDSDESCTLNEACSECLKLRGGCAVQEQTRSRIKATLDMEDYHTRQLMRKTKAELVEMILDMEVVISDKEEALTVFRNL